jgi:integrase
MGCSIRKKDDNWYVFIRHAGERAALKCVDEEHAKDTQKAVLTAIAAQQFDIGAFQRKREERNEEKPRTPTLDEFFEKTMVPLWEATRAQGTYERYEQAYEQHIRPELGHVLVGDITRDCVKDFIVTLLKKSVARRTRMADGAKDLARKFSYDSIRIITATLRAMLTEAVERNLIVANPAMRVGKFFAEAESGDAVDPFSSEEIPLLLQTTRTYFGFEDYVALLCLLHSGVRSSELRGLRWPDLDVRGKFLNVRKQFKDGRLKRTKQKKARKVDVSDALLHELLTLKKRRTEEYFARGEEMPEWIFLGPGNIIWQDGKPVGRGERSTIDMKNINNRVLQKACDKAQIRRRSVHDCRHTFATVLLMAGESPVYVREQCGHSSIRVTVDLYAHWIPGSNRQAVNKIPSLTTPKVQSKIAAD